MSHDPPVDDLTLRKAQSGDVEAFERFLELVYELIFRFAFKWSGDRTDAEDITQLVCIKLARVIQQFRFESSFVSWLYRVVINCATDWWRSEKKNRHDQVDDIDALDQAIPDNRAVSQIELKQVLTDLEHMGEGYKETVLLVHAEGLSHAQAAEILELKESTVSWRLHEVRKHFAKKQKILEENYLDKFSQHKPGGSL